MHVVSERHLPEYESVLADSPEWRRRVSDAGNSGEKRNRGEREDSSEAGGNPSSRTIKRLITLVRLVD